MDDFKNPFSAIVIGIAMEGDDIGYSDGLEVEEPWEVVINIGEDDGVELGQHYVIFSLGPELTDPKSCKSLGHFEQVRGIGVVSHVQKTMCKLRSTRTKQVPINLTSIAAVLGQTGPSPTREVQAPFTRVKIGDLARRV
jgi:hypothetical protein